MISKTSLEEFLETTPFKFKTKIQYVVFPDCLSGALHQARSFLGSHNTEDKRQFVLLDSQKYDVSESSQFSTTIVCDISKPTWSEVNLFECETWWCDVGVGALRMMRNEGEADTVLLD